MPRVIPALLVLITVTGCGQGSNPGPQRAARAWQFCRAAPARAFFKTSASASPSLHAGAGMAPRERRAGRLVDARIVRLSSVAMRREQRRRVARGIESLAPAQLGVGVLLDDGEVITAGHVVAGPVVLETPRGPVAATVVSRDRRYDLAWLRPDRALKARGHLTIARPGEHVTHAVLWTRSQPATAIRDPIAMRLLMLGSGTAAWRDITAVDADRSVHDALRACGGNLARGMSGSPVLNQFGALIGVAVAAGGQPANVTGVLIAPVAYA